MCFFTTTSSPSPVSLQFIELKEIVDNLLKHGVVDKDTKEWRSLVKLYGRSFFHRVWELTDVGRQRFMSFYPWNPANLIDMTGQLRDTRLIMNQLLI